ncbi:hypothetical protein MN0502_12330 [Arthrobacter sp. MN05-02]|nr:hypothetical protein MN0502_12330 [Arthrobacter sp. MN05-02]
MRHLTQGTALALADVTEDVADFMAENYHLALLGLALCILCQPHITPTDDAVYGYGLLYHLYRLLPQ